IQGGLFRREKGRVTADSRPFVLTNKVGAMFATPKYSLNLHFTYQSKEAEFQEARHVFGGLNFSYRFR
ncbi:MAG TPA: lipid A-modifier LpxR family protein, partial [Segetibacter sp.]